MKPNDRLSNCSVLMVLYRPIRVFLLHNHSKLLVFFVLFFLQPAETECYRRLKHLRGFGMKTLIGTLKYPNEILSAGGGLLNVKCTPSAWFYYPILFSFLFYKIRILFTFVTPCCVVVSHSSISWSSLVRMTPVLLFNDR